MFKYSCLSTKDSSKFTENCQRIGKVQFYNSHNGNTSLANGSWDINSTVFSKIAAIKFNSHIIKTSIERDFAKKMPTF